MPAQKRLHKATQEDEEALRTNDVSNVDQPEDEVESDRSKSSNNRDKEEYVVIKLSDVRKEVQCPICLGIIQKTRTVMECLHRFCRECIDKSMRLGNNECPACRTHCASRRSLRDDPNYDALIAVLYPDIDKYEEEELALHEDEVTHNKQIQASIAQTLQRQTEALSKRRYAKATAVAFLRRSQDVADEEKIPEGDREEIITSSGRFAWGKNGHRSNTRVNSKNSGSRSSGNKKSRISRLVDHLHSSEEVDQLDTFLVIVSLDQQRIPSLEEPYLQCRPTLSVGKLIKYIAIKTAQQDDEVELCVVEKPGQSQATIVSGGRTVELDKDKLRTLGEQETLAELTSSNLILGHLIMAYKRKLQNSDIAAAKLER